jgi:hypothetical protein
MPDQLNINDSDSFKENDSEFDSSVEFIEQNETKSNEQVSLKKIVALLFLFIVIHCRRACIGLLYILWLVIRNGCRQLASSCAYDNDLNDNPSSANRHISWTNAFLPA